MNGCVYRTEDNKCEFYSDYGKGIVSYCDFDDCEEKKLSNADRIRHSSDEELAEWVWGVETAGRAYGLRGKNAWLEWLKQEVE